MLIWPTQSVSCGGESLIEYKHVMKIYQQKSPPKRAIRNISFGI